MLSNNIYPRISIVTPSYNQGKYIEETIQSVLRQEYPNLEYIIIDGGSTDNTIEIIKTYQEHLAYWVSERDSGQSNAINKGITRCTGEIFNWLNSDDLLIPNALLTVAKTWKENPGRIISGGTEFFNNKGVFKTVNAAEQTLRNFIRFWEATDFQWAQQSTFVPLASLKKIGGIREDLKYCMDYNMMVRLLMEGLQASYVKETLARFRFHTESKTVGQTEEFRLERVEMLRNITDLPIQVLPKEWDYQQALRLVDVGKHSIYRGNISKGLKFLICAFAASPGGAIHEIFTRTINKIVRIIRKS
jgi:glycosyltransferase involved in cell wall biosynthesis